MNDVEYSGQKNIFLKHNFNFWYSYLFFPILAFSQVSRGGGQIPGSLPCQEEDGKSDVFSERSKGQQST
jgi:hypothetical protein